MKDWREILFFSLIFVGFLAILAKLFFLQILRGDYFKALAFGLSFPILTEQKQRGEIVFRDGTPLAIQKPIFILTVLPKKIKDKEKVAQILGDYLKMEKTEILEKLKREKPFLIEIEEKEVFGQLRKEKLEGIFFDQGFKRYYPQKELAAHVVGFLGGEGRGQYGIEEYYNEELSRGENLILTLDYQIQFEAEKILKKAKEKLGFERGQILVLNPQNGEILALACFPSFDPNNYKDFAKNLEIFKNPITQEIFEPGSVLKPITMAIALEEKKITPQTTYEDPGQIEIDGWIIRNYANRKYPGKITMTEVLEKSINTGAVFAQQKVEAIVFLNYLKEFGFFEKTGIDLSEIFSENSELKKARPINLATASFGQGIALTPIQLARAFGAIANGGKIITPHLRIDFPKEKMKDKMVISKENSQKLTQMLISVVENGFGKGAKIKGYFIAGKTGTALQPKFGEKGYSEKTWQSFVGYFPIQNPEYLILVKLDNPKTKTAEYSAVPLFKEIAEFIILTKQILPDYETY